MISGGAWLDRGRLGLHRSNAWMTQPLPSRRSRSTRVTVVVWRDPALGVSVCSTRQLMRAADPSAESTRTLSMSTSSARISLKARLSPSTSTDGWTFFTASASRLSRAASYAASASRTPASAAFSTLLPPACGAGSREATGARCSAQARTSSPTDARMQPGRAAAGAWLAVCGRMFSAFSPSRELADPCDRPSPSLRGRPERSRRDRALEYGARLYHHSALPVRSRTIIRTPP